MGLKYQVFMMRGTADDLYNRIITGKYAHRFTDTSVLMNREREWLLRPIERDENGKYTFESDDPELVKFMNRDPLFSMWWMDHPTRKNIVVGGFTNSWVGERDYMALLGTILQKHGIEEILFSSYHHPVNGGDVLLLKLLPVPDLTTYQMTENEEYKYGKYAKRVQRETGYPIISWHYYISRPEIHIIPWKYSLDLIHQVKENVSG